MFKNIKADIKRHVGGRDEYSGRNHKVTPRVLIYLIFEQGIWAIMIYRFGRCVRGGRIPVVSLLFRILAFLLFKLTEVITGISLPASARIGKGLYDSSSLSFGFNHK